MRLAWVTPFGSRSAIGRVSAAATRELSARGHEVKIVRSERNRSHSDLVHRTGLPVLWWHDILPADLMAQNDAVIVNLGDNYNLHAGILRFTDAIPCLGIFHDYYLHNFFRAWVAEDSRPEARFEIEAIRTYGEGARATARAAWRGEAGIEQISAHLPMTEWMAGRCDAALAHANFYLDRLSAACPGPIAVTPLYYEGRGVPPLTVRGGEEVTILTAGVLNSNKCADVVISAIAGSPFLRGRCRYRLVGSISESEKSRLQDLCQRLDLDTVSFLGEVDDTTLAAELERADIIAGLRKPVLEGASASAIEGMLAGRPVIVADAGFCSELPDELVFKVARSVEVSAVSEVLGRLVSSEPLRREIGNRAREWAVLAFGAEQYVNALEALIADFVAAGPLLGLGHRIGVQLANLGVAADDPAVGRIARTMQDLFPRT